MTQGVQHEHILDPQSITRQDVMKAPYLTSGPFSKFRCLKQRLQSITLICWTTRAAMCTGVSEPAYSLKIVRYLCPVPSKSNPALAVAVCWHQQLSSYSVAWHEVRLHKGRVGLRLVPSTEYSDLAEHHLIRAIGS